MIFVDANLAGDVRDELENGLDLGAASVLKKYDSKHRRISKPLYLRTNPLVRLYTDTAVPGRILRDAALRVGNILLPVKYQITRQLTQI